MPPTAMPVILLRASKPNKRPVASASFSTATLPSASARAIASNASTLIAMRTLRGHMAAMKASDAVEFHRHVAAIAPCPDNMTRRLHPVERMKSRQAHLLWRRREPYARRLACPPIALQACRQTTPRSWRRSARGSIAGWPRSSARFRPSPRRAASRALAGNWRSKRERPWNCE